MQYSTELSMFTGYSMKEDGKLLIAARKERTQIHNNLKLSLEVGNKQQGVTFSIEAFNNT